MNIFNYESKVSQVLMFVADLIILNVCFILCCIPVFTIGAAQAALYSGVRTLLDPETDEKPRRIFFKEFVNSFSVTDVSFYKTEVRVVHYRCQCGKVACICQLVKTYNAVVRIFAQHMEHKVGTDEAGTAGQ